MTGASSRDRRLPSPRAWTDASQHDPGVTLLELLAWVVGALSLGLGLYAYLASRKRPRRPRC